MLGGTSCSGPKDVLTAASSNEAELWVSGRVFVGWDAGAGLEEKKKLQSPLDEEDEEDISLWFTGHSEEDEGDEEDISLWFIGHSEEEDVGNEVEDEVELDATGQFEVEFSFFWELVDLWWDTEPVFCIFVDCSEISFEEEFIFLRIISFEKIWIFEENILILFF